MEGIRLETELAEVNGTKVLIVNGEIDVYTAPKFKEALDIVLRSGQKNLIINMEHVTYMDSSGFGALLSATKKLRPEGGSVNLVRISNAIERILRITRLNTIFNTYDDVDEAVQKLGQS